MFLEIRNISKSYDNKKIIENINISINEGEFVSLLGESGSGKSTLFNILAGIEKSDSGDIYFKTKKITNENFCSYMHQKDLLLPFYTVLDNIALPLIIKGISKKEAYKKIYAHLETFSLLGVENKFPNQLSGGMRQRASLLRAYINSQEMILLDEPFSSLDSITKKKLYRWYKDIMTKSNTTTFFITHDIDEAILLSDKIFILKGNPSTITNCVEITKNKTNNFEFTNEYLEYKKILIQKITSL